MRLKMLEIEGRLGLQVLGAISEALGVGDFKEWSEDKKCDWLVRTRCSPGTDR